VRARAGDWVECVILSCWTAFSQLLNRILSVNTAAPAHSIALRNCTPQFMHSTQPQRQPPQPHPLDPTPSTQPTQTTPPTPQPHPRSPAAAAASRHSRWTSKWRASRSTSCARRSPRRAPAGPTSCGRWRGARRRPGGASVPTPP